MPDSIGGGTSRGMRPTDLEGELAAARARNTELEAELAIVNEVGQALARQLDFESVMEAVGERALIRFDRRQRSLTPGQAIAFYSGEDVLGGGTIERAWRGERR